jgi:energy-coupling factor transporter ATP-binding protein EcfA2
VSEDNVAYLPAPGRKLSSWVAGFLELTDGIQSPEIFRKWSAITAIAGALEQKIWIRSQGEILYPNLYTFLVGPSGSGKTRALRACNSLWQELRDTHFVAPIKLSKSSLVDVLAKATRIIRGTHQFNSLLIAAGELGVLIPGYDSDFMNALTYIYDVEKYDEQFRNVHKGEALVIEKPQINLLACCTPSFLTELMPAGAWEQGFLSRVIIVYSGHTDIQPLDLLGEAIQRTNPLAAALAHDIKKIGDEKNYRRLAFTREAAAALENWHITRHGAPDHPRLTNYSSRRTTHLLKLSMIAAMDHSDAEVIEAHDVQCAQDWLIEAETYMPDVFKAMSSGGDAELTKELHHYIRTHTARTGQGVPAHHIFLWLRSRAPAHSHRDLVDLMLKAGMVRSEISGGVIVYFAKDHDKGD